MPACGEHPAPAPSPAVLACPCTAADAPSVSRRISACRAILCTVTLAIAILGAVTGIIGCGIAVVNAVRDRSRVVIGATTHHLGAQRKVVITVANNGRQPALVVDAGVGAEVERFGRWPRRKVLPMVLTATPPDGAFPRKIDPFDAYTWTVELAPGQSAPPLDRMYASLATGKTVWWNGRTPKPTR